MIVRTNFKSIQVTWQRWVNHLAHVESSSIHKPKQNYSLNDAELESNLSHFAM